jgi:hypothetical protein
VVLAALAAAARKRTTAVNFILTKTYSKVKDCGKSKFSERLGVIERRCLFAGKCSGKCRAERGLFIDIGLRRDRKKRHEVLIDITVASCTVKLQVAKPLSKWARKLYGLMPSLSLGTGQRELSYWLLLA